LRHEVAHLRCVLAGAVRFQPLNQAIDGTDGARRKLPQCLGKKIKPLAHRTVEVARFEEGLFQVGGVCHSFLQQRMLNK